MLRTPNLGRLAKEIADESPQRQDIESALAQCDNDGLVALSRIVFCMRRTRLLSLVKSTFTQPELEFLEKLLMPRDFYVKQLICSANKEDFAVAALSLLDDRLLGISQYFYAKTGQELQNKAAESFGNSILQYLLYAWCNQCRFARRQTQVEAQQLVSAMGPQLLIQLLCTTTLAEFAEMSKNFRLMTNNTIYDYFQQKGTFGGDLFYFGYACAVLENDVISFILSQKSLLGERFQSVLITTILLFRDWEYGRKDLKEKLSAALGEIGNLTCSVCGVK